MLCNGRGLGNDLVVVAGGDSVVVMAAQSFALLCIVVMDKIPKGSPT